MPCWLVHHELPAGYTSADLVAWKASFAARESARTARGIAHSIIVYEGANPAPASTYSIDVVHVVKDHINGKQHIKEFNGQPLAAGIGDKRSAMNCKTANPSANPSNPTCE